MAGPRRALTRVPAAAVRCAWLGGTRGWPARRFSGLRQPRRPASPRRTGTCLTELGWLSLPPTGRCWDLGHPEVAAPPTEVPNPPGYGLKPSLPRRRGEGNEKEESEGRQRPRFWGSPWMVAGAAAGGRGARPSSGRGGRAGFLLPRHGDRSVAVARIPSRCDLGTREGQHAVGRQGAGESRLVHVGRQAVAAVELAGDVAMVVLGGEAGTVREATSPYRGGSSPTGSRASWTARGSSPWPLPGRAGRRGSC